MANYMLGPLSEAQKELVEEALGHLHNYFCEDSELAPLADEIDNLPPFQEVN